LPADVDHTLEALADPTRRAVVGLLRHAPRRPSELAEVLDVSRPAISRHLRVLRRAGLIEEAQRQEDDARVRMYRLRPEPFIELGRWLAEVEGFWGDQLVAFKEHAERTRGARTA